MDKSLKLVNGYPTVYYDFLSNVVLSGHADMIIPLPLPSSVAAKVLADHYIRAELIYIDGSHEYEDVAADIVNYRKLATTNGIMFGDDMVWPGVKHAVLENIPPQSLYVDGEFWTHPVLASRPQSELPRFYPESDGKGLDA